MTNVQFFFQCKWCASMCCSLSVWLFDHEKDSWDSDESFYISSLFWGGGKGKGWL